MAKQTIGLGAAPNDKSGDSARVAGQKINENFTEVYDDIAALQASGTLIKGVETCDGTNGQTITYPTTRAATPPAITDYEGNGIELVSYDTTGFVINSINSGNFVYLQ